MSCDNDDVVVAAGTNIQVLESRVTAVKIPTQSTFVSQTSCDGLVCVYSLYHSGLVANPTTRWSRTFPHNSSELGLDNATTCEVFDFAANAWRYVLPSAPHRILAHREPLFFDGSLHWFTEGQEEETKVLSFHLHTETFQLISSPPPFVDHVHPEDIAMCTLNNRLCVCHKTRLIQLIWSFDSGNKNKTWVNLYSINLTITSSWFGMHTLPLSALSLPATTTGGKTKLLLYDREFHEHKQRLVEHDPETNSYHLVFTAKSIGLPLCFSQSLISIS